ncbi:MAG: RIP metalloprotease RseP [Candidatus Eiseniibacteriota bacterium]
MILDVLIPGILLLGILVFLHELGHFLMAKWLRVPVYKFSLGFGPAMFAFDRGETRYQVSWLPLGGYVSMAEETKDAEGKPDLIDRFSEQPWWKRLVIALAGPAGNLVTGYLALVVMGVVGVRLPDYDAVLGPIEPGTRAASYGLVEGVRITSLAGATVTSYQDFLRKISELPKGSGLALAVTAPDGAVRTVDVPAAERDAVLNDLRPPEAGTEVGSVVIGTPAYLAGLQGGDRIVAIGGKPISRWRELTDVVSRSAGKPLDFAVDRKGKAFNVTITPQAPPTANAWEGGRIGIEAPRNRTFLVRSSFPEAVLSAFPLSRVLIAQTFEGIAAVLTRPFQSAGSLGGPQMIIQVAGANAKRGAGDFIYILAVISFAIMAFNLLPLPVLDGGHIFLALVEAVRRRPPAAWFTVAYQRVGLVLIGGFIVFVLFNDLSRSLQHRAAVNRNNQASPGEVEPAR